MSNTLSVRVTNRKTEAGEWYEGTVSIAGLKPTKLARKADGSTQFPTKSSVTGAARSLAKSLGFSDIDLGEKATAKSVKAPVKTAAKKAAVIVKKKTTCTGDQTTTCSQPAN
jgi:hypothetical protein